MRTAPSGSQLTTQVPPLECEPQVAVHSFAVCAGGLPLLRMLYYFLYTTPPFITNETFCSAAMSCSGSPEPR